MNLIISPDRVKGENMLPGWGLTLGTFSSINRDKILEHLYVPFIILFGGSIVMNK